MDGIDSVRFVDVDIFETGFFEGGVLDEADLVAHHTDFVGPAGLR